MTRADLDKLIDTVNPRAKLPRGFGLWSLAMQIAWLQQNQKKEFSREHRSSN